MLGTFIIPSNGAILDTGVVVGQFYHFSVFLEDYFFCNQKWKGGGKHIPQIEGKPVKVYTWYDSDRN